MQTHSDQIQNLRLLFQWSWLCVRTYLHKPQTFVYFEDSSRCLTYTLISCGGCLCWAASLHLVTWVQSSFSLQKKQSREIYEIWESVITTPMQYTSGQMSVADMMYICCTLHYCTLWLCPHQFYKAINDKATKWNTKSKLYTLKWATLQQ